MKNLFLFLFIFVAAMQLVSCNKESVDDPVEDPVEDPVVSEDVLMSNDILNHKLIHVVDISSDDTQDLVIPSAYDAATISVTSTDSNFSCEELTVEGERVLRFDIDMDGQTKRLIPVKVTIDGVSEDYNRNFFLLAVDKSSTEVKSEAITSVYSQSMGRGTYCYGSLGNVTKPILDYDLLVSHGTKYITADRPIQSTEMYEKSGETYSQTMESWSYSVGVDFKHTLKLLSRIGGKLSLQKSSKSISGTTNYGMSSNMEQDAGFEYYFNFYKVQCQNIKIDISSFNSSQNTNIVTADTTFLSIIDPDLISQFQNTNLDADSFVKEWGTDIIYKALYGGAYINYYARSENVYSQSVMKDADASLSFRSSSGSAAAGQWLKIFQAKNSDHITSTTDMSYMSSEYQKASNYCEDGVSFGGNYQDDADEWIDGFAAGTDAASDLSVIISYKPTSDTSADSEDFSLYQMDVFCCDLYNAIVMLYDQLDELTAADSAVLEAISQNAENISVARQTRIEDNIGEESNIKSRMILADFMMLAESDDSHESGRPQPFVGEDPNRSGEYLIYYPIIANKYSPEEDAKGYALDTASDTYMNTTQQAHVWYYALGREGDVNPIKEILFSVNPSDDSMVARGDKADQGVLYPLNENRVWLKYDKVENSTDAITAVCLMADDDGEIIGSSGGAEINGSPSPEKLETFNTFWTEDYTKYTDIGSRFYEMGGIFVKHQVCAGYSTNDLPVDRLNESTVYQAQTW